MWPTLLDQFLQEEGSPGVCRLVLDAIDAALAAAGHGPRRLSMNRFDFCIDGDSGLVILEDDLDPTSSQVVGIHEFRAAIQSWLVRDAN